MNAHRRNGRRRTVHAIASFAGLPRPLYLAEPLELRMLLAIAPAGGEFRVSTSDLGYERPTLAIDADRDGGFVVVWSRGSSEVVDARRYNAAGQPVGDEFVVNSMHAGAQSVPDVAVADDSDFVVVWSNYGLDGSRGGIYAQRYDAGGARLGEAFRVNTTTAEHQTRPAAAVDAAGNVVVAWQSFRQDRTGSDIYAQRYSAAGLPLGGEFRVNTTTDGWQAAPSVAVHDNGEFVIAWSSGGSIAAQRFNAAGAPAGGEFLVNTPVTEVRYASVGIDGNGGFVVAWSGSDPGTGSFGVYARRYGADGQPLASQFRANTAFNWHLWPLTTSIAVDPQGGFLVAWDDPFQTRARYFDPAGKPTGGEVPRPPTTRTANCPRRSRWTTTATTSSLGPVIAPRASRIRYLAAVR